MEIVKFTLSGVKATFTRPYFNSYYSTYSHIHKVALLGLLGAMIGIKREITEDGMLLAYSELESLKIAIVPHKIQFPEVRNTITETTGMFNKGNTYVADYMEICNPAWDIYIYSNGNVHYDKTKEFILEKKSIYHIFLGKNHHFASISNPEVLEGIKVDEVSKIDSLFIKEEVDTDEDIDDEGFERVYFQEAMPIAMDRRLNQYLIKTLVLTNEKVEWCKDYNSLVQCGDKTLFLI